jgi:methylthioribose-1-phosphate isomerase
MMMMMTSTSTVTPPQALTVLALHPTHAELLDQTALPATVQYVEIHTPQAMTHAIQTMIVRGAPAIGIAGAFGIVLSARIALKVALSTEAFHQHVLADAEILRQSRPTAVNLMWAIDRMLTCLELLLKAKTPLSETVESLSVEALAIHEEDLQANYAMGRFGAVLLPKNARIHTHCNAGALATAGHGTALGVVREAFAQGRCSMVYADETRPRLQGGKLTTWELVQAGIPVTLVCDGMSGHMMQKGMVDAVIVGADRIASNGDTANKIGTYNLALAAKAHGVPFYVAAPSSTFDFTLASGTEIPIEERDAEEVLGLDGNRYAPEGVQVYNPGFDVTPAHCIAGIITEKGVVLPPFSENLKALLG